MIFSGRQKGHDHNKVGPPPVISWFRNPLTIDISSINHIIIGLICTNLANELGHHLAQDWKILDLVSAIQA